MKKGLFTLLYEAYEIGVQKGFSEGVGEAMIDDKDFLEFIKNLDTEDQNDEEK